MDRTLRSGSLLALTVAVLLAHFAPLLQPAPATIRAQEPAMARAVSTRTEVATSPSTPAGPADNVAAVTLKIPASVRLEYDVRAEVQGLTANALAELFWRHDDHAYDARLDLTLPLVGTRTQTSVGRMTPAGLAPTRFSDKARRELVAHFERTPNGAGGRIVFSADTPAVPLMAGAQDQLSAFLQLGAMLAGAPGKYPSGTPISLQIAGPRDADVWLFTVGKMQQLRLPYGELDTVKLTRSPRHESDSKVEMWLAPSMGYLPVRIRLTQANGDQFDQRLRAIDRP